MNSEDIPLTAIYVLGRVELLHLAEPMLFFLCHGFARGKEDGNEGDSDEKNDEREDEKKNPLIAISFLPLSIRTSKEAFPSVYLSLSPSQLLPTLRDNLDSIFCAEPKKFPPLLL